MSAHLFDRWADALAREGIVSAEDVELYSYGLSQGLLFLLNIATALLVGALLGEMAACVVFMACYLPLRSMAGGYHARTPLRCYVLGIVLVAAALAAVKWLPWTGTLIVLAAALASVLIWRLAPVADANKPLDEAEILRYRGKARKLTLGVWLVVLGGLLISQPLAASGAVALLANSLMLVLGLGMQKNNAA